MNINRTPARDFALARAAADPEFWLSNAFATVAGGSIAALQQLYEERAFAQIEADKATPEWAQAAALVSGSASDTQILLAGRDAGLFPTVAEIEAARPIPEPPLPQAISDRQFAQQLAVIGAITEAEALAWAARGDLPDAIEAAIATMPESDRFGARMLLASATSYQRGHPLVPALAGLLGYDDEALDDLWRAAAAL